MNNIKLICLFLFSISHSFCEFENNHKPKKNEQVTGEQDSVNPYRFIDLKRNVQKEETECLGIFYDNLKKESKNKEQSLGYLCLGLGEKRGCILWRQQGKIKGYRLIYLKEHLFQLRYYQNIRQ
jgi:hypothetical protein